MEKRRMIYKPYTVAQDLINGKYYIKERYFVIPDSWYDTEEDCQVQVRQLNVAYEEGYKQAQSDIRKSLGIK